MLSDNVADLLIKCSQVSDLNEAALSEAEGTDDADEQRRAKWRRIFAILGTIAAGGGLAYGVSKFRGSDLEKFLQGQVARAADAVSPRKSSHMTTGAGAGALAGLASGAKGLRTTDPMDVTPDAATKGQGSNIIQKIKDQLLPYTPANRSASEVLTDVARIAEKAPKTSKGKPGAEAGGSDWLSRIFGSIGSARAEPDQSMKTLAADADPAVLRRIAEQLRTRSVPLSMADLQQRVQEYASLPPDKVEGFKHKDSVEDLLGGFRAAGDQSKTTAVASRMAEAIHPSTAFGKRVFKPAAKATTLGGIVGGLLGSQIPSSDPRYKGEVK